MKLETSQRPKAGQNQIASALTGRLGGVYGYRLHKGKITVIILSY